MQNEFIGVVKCNDWNDLEDVSQRGWCFDYNDWKDDLYIVWFPANSLQAVLDAVNKYTLLEINGFGEPMLVHKNGNLESIKALIKNRKDIWNSVKDDCYKNSIKKCLKKLKHSYEIQKVEVI